MTKLALSDEILMKIDKPARYIGNELNSIKKDKEKVAIRFAMCFPDHILAFRFYMICLIKWKMCGVREFTLHGRIFIKS